MRWESWLLRGRYIGRSSRRRYLKCSVNGGGEAFNSGARNSSQAVGTANFKVLKLGCLTVDRDHGVECVWLKQAAKCI